MSRTIHATAGGIEYVTAQVVEANGQDLSSCAWQIGLSTSYADPPAVWLTPSKTAFPAAGQAAISTLVDNSTTPGTYWLWVRDTDNPETLIRQCVNDRITVI